MFSFEYIKDLNSCCRTCLNATGTMHEIFSYRLDSTLADILSFCSNIKVNHQDVLPKKLCSTCFNCLVSFFDFRRRAEKIDQDLRTHIQSLQEKVKLENNNDSTHYLDIKCEKDDDKVEKDDDDDNISWNNSENDFFPPKHKLLSKSNQHKNVKIINYFCEICKKNFKKQDIFQKHVIKHKKNIYKCDYCSTYFSQKKKMVKHLETHDPNKTKPCMETCQVKRNGSENLNLKDECVLSSNENVVVKIEPYTEVENNEELNYECGECAAKFKSIYSLSAHNRKHTQKNRVLKCSVCEKVFKRSHHLKRHEMIHDANRLFQCNICPRSFTRESYLNDHLAVHANVKPHSCSVCSKSFVSISALEKHSRVHNREKRTYMCPHCGRTFACSTNLNQHVKRHGMKKHACPLCPRAFYSTGELKSHSLTHTGVRAHACDQCGSTFTKRTSLTKHMKRHHLGIRPHQCGTCFMRFSGKDHLTRHYRIHTGEKPYRCDMCERAFTQSNDLLKHRRTHLGDNIYKCDKCTASFRLRKELLKHISEHFVSSRRGDKTDSSTTDNQVSDLQTNEEHIDVETTDSERNKSANSKKKLNESVEKLCLEITLQPDK